MFLNCRSEEDGEEVEFHEEEKRIITDKDFYKQMQKLKDRGTSAVPPKKSASAYIIFGKEVSLVCIIIFNNRKGLKY